MKNDSDVREFPFVADLPKREKSKVAKLWDELAEYEAMIEEHGALIPVQAAAELLGVSRQRVDELTTFNRLHRVEFRGTPFITKASLLERARTEKSKGGRPPLATTAKK